MSVTVTNYRDGFMQIVTPEPLAGDGGNALNHNFKLIDDQMMVNPLDFAGYGDGTGDNTAAINTANNYAVSGHKFLLFPSGVFKVNSNLTINATTVFQGGILKPASGVSITFGSGDLIAPIAQIFDGSLNSSLTRTGILFAATSPVDTVYPQWWGAIADGVSDATTAIQLAIDSVTYNTTTQKVGTVKFKSGLYDIASPLYVGYDFVNYSNVKAGQAGNLVTHNGSASSATRPGSRKQRVQLHGEGSVKINYTGSATTAYLLYYTGEGGFVSEGFYPIRNLHFDANYKSRGIYITSCAYTSTVENIIINSTSGIGIDSIDNWGTRMNCLEFYTCYGMCVRMNNFNSCSASTWKTLSYGMRDELWPDPDETGIVDAQDVTIQTPVSSRATIYIEGSNSFYDTMVLESIHNSIPYTTTLTRILDGTYKSSFSRTGHGLASGDPVWFDSTALTVESVNGSTFIINHDPSGTFGTSASRVPVYRRATSITQDGSGVVSCTNHGMATDQRVKIISPSGMVEVSGVWTQITKIDSDSFALNIDTTAYSASNGSERIVSSYPAVVIAELQAGSMNATRFEGTYAVDSKIQLNDNASNVKIDGLLSSEKTDPEGLNAFFGDYVIRCVDRVNNCEFKNIDGNGIISPVVFDISDGDYAHGNRIENVALRSPYPLSGPVVFNVVDEVDQQANYIEGTWTPVFAVTGDTTPSVWGDYAGINCLGYWGVRRNGPPLYFPVAYNGVVTDFDDGINGQILSVLARGSNVTIADNGNIATESSANVTLTANHPTQFILDSGVWCQIGSTKMISRYETWTMQANGWTIPTDSYSGCIIGDVITSSLTYPYSKSYAASGAGKWITTASTSTTGIPPYPGPSYFFPSNPSGGDAVAFGYSVPFCEKYYTDTVFSPGIYNDTGILEWSYSTVGDTWSSLSIIYDGSSTGTSKAGDMAFTQPGAISFIPPSDWTSNTVDSQDAYWIKATVASGKGGNITTVPVQWSANPRIVFPSGGFVCPRNGTVEDIWIYDRATTTHSGTAVKFILMNFDTGQYTGEHTWDVNQKQDMYTDLSLAVSSGDRLAILITQEDSGNNDPANVVLKLGTLANAYI